MKIGWELTTKSANCIHPGLCASNYNNNTPPPINTAAGKLLIILFLQMDGQLLSTYVFVCRCLCHSLRIFSIHADIVVLVIKIMKKCNVVYFHLFCSEI